MEIYKNTIIQCDETIKRFNKKINVLSFARLILFAIAIMCLYQAVANKSYPMMICVFVSIGLFAYLYILDSGLKAKRAWEQEKRKFCREEAELAENKQTDRDEGTCFIDTEHAFSYDLDLFGRQSLFYFLNRTATAIGKNALAVRLKSPSVDVNKIVSDQNAVKELSVDMAWCIDFVTTGRGINDANKDVNDFIDWMQSTPDDLLKKPSKALLLIFPILNVLFLTATIILKLPYALPIVVFIIELLVLNVKKYTIETCYENINQRSGFLDKYSRLIRLIELKPFSTQGLEQCKSMLVCGETAASNEIRKLKSIVDAFDNRNNVLLRYILNYAFLWDLQCVYRAQEWNRRNKDVVSDWFSSISQIDVLVSIAVFAYNNKDNVFPSPASKNIIIQAKQVSHPLISRVKRVYNDFDIASGKKMYIVTGANMAGKSTFLRIVGINYVLAMIGAPVCATAFAFNPLSIFTSMRVNDSVSKGESYFFSELKRIKKIIDLLEGGTPCFFIIDEPLKGTNSRDKLTGTELLIKRIMEEKVETCGLLATHDLQLTNLVDQYPGHLFNKCLEVQIKDDNILCDYKIRDGVTRNMNAVQLMKKMKII